jgi:hypothetical protein
MEVRHANSNQKRERQMTAYKSKKYVDVTDEELVKEEPADDALVNGASVRRLHSEPGHRRKSRRTPRPPPPVKHDGVVPPVGHALRKELLTCDTCRGRNIFRSYEDAGLPAEKRRPLFECVVPDAGACSNCRWWKTKCSRVPASWGKRRRGLGEQAELQWKISGIEPPWPKDDASSHPGSRERRRPASSGNRKRQRSSRRDSSTKSSDAEEVVLLGKDKEVVKGKGKERERGRERKRGRSELEGNDADEDEDEDDNDSREQKPAKRRRHRSPAPVTRLQRRVSTPVTNQQLAKAGSSTRTRWIEKSDGAQGRKITVARAPPPSALERMGARQDVVDTRLLEVERAVAGTGEMQREVLQALNEMSDNLRRISIQVPAAPARQSATDMQLNGYARRMHRIEAALQGLTAGLETNRREIDGVNRRLNDRRNNASPAVPSHPEHSATSLDGMEIDLDMFVHSEAMEDGPGPEGAPHLPVIQGRVNQAIQADLVPTPFHIIVTNASPPRSSSSAFEQGVIETGHLSPDAPEIAEQPAQPSPQDAISMQDLISNEAPVVDQTIAHEM